MAVLPELQIVFKGAGKFSLLWILWQRGLYLTLFNQLPGQPIDGCRGNKSTDFFKMLTDCDGKKLLPRQTAVFDKIQKQFQLPAVQVFSGQAIVDGFHPMKVIGSSADQSGSC